MSRREGQHGTPEKPLSPLGEVSYHAYWKSVILRFLAENDDVTKISINGIANKTGISPHDIAATLVKLKMIERNPESGKFKIIRPRDLIDQFLEKERKSNRHQLNESALKWTPIGPEIINEEMDSENDEDIQAAITESKRDSDQQPANQKPQPEQKIKKKRKRKSMKGDYDWNSKKKRKTNSNTRYDSYPMTHD